MIDQRIDRWIRWIRWIWRIAAIGVVAANLVGCRGPRASAGGFDSDNPASKLYAIHDAGVNRDATKLQHLVAELDSDDPTVRLMSIEALERITATRLGYNPYDGPAKRHDAIQAWADAVRSGQFTAPPQP